MTKPNPMKAKAKAEPTKPDLRPATPAELAAGKAAIEGQAERPARASLTVKSDGVGGITISNPHADWQGWSAHISETFGTSSNDFAHAAFQRACNAIANRGEPLSERQANTVLALMGAIAPTNELEAALGEQIVGAHALTMELFSKAKHTDTMDKLNTYTNLANKTARTTGALVETLSKLRAGGKQTHEVRYYYINGPAAFGDGAQQLVTGGGGALPHFPGQSLAPSHFPGLEAAPGVPMRGQNPQGDALSVAGREGPQALPDARRDEPRSAEGEGQRGLSDGDAHRGGSGAAAPGPPAREGEP